MTDVPSFYRSEDGQTVWAKPELVQHMEQDGLSVQETRQGLLTANTLRGGERRNMNPTRETLVDIYHPTFRQGYQRGRAHSFQEQTVLTDKQLVECLQAVMLDTSPQEQACEDDLYYAIGQFVGQMSACVIPCQPHEDQTRSVRERFLLILQRTSGPAGEALLDLIRTYWHTQDQLARRLDADTFDLVLHAGEQRGKGHA